MTLRLYWDRLMEPSNILAYKKGKRYPPKFLTPFCASSLCIHSSHMQWVNTAKVFQGHEDQEKGDRALKTSVGILRSHFDTNPFLITIMFGALNSTYE